VAWGPAAGSSRFSFSLMEKPRSRLLDNGDPLQRQLQGGAGSGETFA